MPAAPRFAGNAPTQFTVTIAACEWARAPKQNEFPKGVPLGGWVRSAVAPNGRYFATWNRGQGLKLWGKGQAATLISLSDPVWDCCAAAYSPDGRTLATGGGRGAITLWDVEAGTERVRTFGHPTGVHSLIFSPDGRTLASLGNPKSGDPVRLWDALTAHLLAELPGTSQVRCLAFSPDGCTLAAGTEDGTVLLFDGSPQKEAEPQEAH